MFVACPSCGRQSPDTSRFCPDCGVSLVANGNQAKTQVWTTPAVQPANVPPLDPNRQMNPLTDFVPGLWPPIPLPQLEHLVQVMDISLSMDSPYDRNRSKLKAASRAGCALTLDKCRLDPNDEIGVVRFNHAAHVVCGLLPVGTYKQQIIDSLQALSADGGTDIAAGLKVTGDLFDWNRTGVTRRIVLLTDGHGGEPLWKAEELKNRGVVIDVIGVGDSPSAVDEKLLKKVASVVQGEIRYRFIKDQKTLVDHYTQLAGKTKVGA